MEQEEIMDISAVSKDVWADVFGSARRADSAGSFVDVYTIGSYGKGVHIYR